MEERQSKVREYEFRPTPRRWLGYTVAVVGTAVAVLIRWVLLQTVGPLPLYLTFYPVAFAAAIVGGTRPGLLATLLSVLAAALFFIEPIGKLEPSTTADVVGIGLFIAINCAVSILGGRLRRQSEAVRESQARLLLAHQTAHIGAFEWNLKTGVNLWTQALEAMYGLKPGEFGGTEEAWEQLVHPEDRAKAVGTVDRAVRTFQPQEGEWRVIWPDGSVHWLMGRFQAFADHAGEPVRLVGANVDITARKRAEEDLHRSEERFRALVTASSDVVYRMSPDWSEMRQLRREFMAGTEVPSSSWLEKYIYPEDQPHMLVVVKEAIRTKRIFKLEHRVRRVDGTLGWALSRAVPLLDAKGEIVEWFGAATDVTERKEAERALRESEERFRTMANAIPQLVWIARPDGSIFWFNQRCYEYTGATPEQLEGCGWESVVDPEALPGLLERWRRSIVTGEPYDLQFPIRGADGRFRAFLSRVRPLKDNEGRVTLWFGTHTDIAELQEAQEALRQSEERFRTLIEQAPTAIGISRNGIALYVNQKYLETFGSRHADEYVGRPVSEHWAPESQAIIAERIHERSLDLQTPTTFEGVAKRQDGSWFPAYVATTVVNLSDGPASVAFITDITERKRLQEHLEEAVEERTAKLHEALAELEHMSYSMVHDMRAPLRAMQSFAGLMQEECADNLPPPAPDYLQRIGEASNRLDRLITDALSYNQVVRENLPVTPVDLGQLLRGMVQTYPKLHPPAADITIEFTGLMVLGNESLLTQCFGNLLDNAVKFVAPGVHPRVRVWAEAVKSPRFGVQRPKLAIANSEIRNPKSEIETAVRIWVEDNGIGIPKDAQEKIFRMFQRMHRESEYSGTGIGLAIVRKAVERMNGRIGLDSEPGKGTRFCVELPRPAEDQAGQRLWQAA